ncbi:MAG: ABC transporter permease, partial [Pseudomonadota bacterium]|nr:ABC transporter permease [Pseudomonadota bacterium]
SMLPAFSGPWLYNRLLWTAVMVLFLAVAYFRYSFADEGMSKRKQKKQRLEQLVSSEATAARTSSLALPSAEHGRTAVWPLFWLRTKFEMKHVFKSPAFILLLMFVMFVTFFVLITDRDPDGRPSYATTVSMIDELMEVFAVVPMIIVILYAGELVWRERDRRMHEIIDTAPFPNWAYVVPKTTAVVLVLLCVFLIGVAAAVGIQLSLGFTRLDLDQYLLWYVLPMTYDILLVTALAIFVHSVSPHKFVGWGVMMIYVLLQFTPLQVPWAPDHNLLDYGGTPAVPLSDMNGLDSFWKGPWVFRLYWGALALLLLVAAHLLWRRGTEIRLKPRLKLATRRLAGAPGMIGGAALLTFTATGAYAYYNTNILNRYETVDERNAFFAEYEKKYLKYERLPHPTISDAKLNVALYPDDRRAVTNGRYRLTNLTDRPITDIHVRLGDHDARFGGRQLELTSVAVPAARLIYENAKDGYRIFRLDEPMRPGEDRVMAFGTRRWYRGFANGAPNTRLVENGTFLSTNELLPVIGMNRSGLLESPADRRKYRLPPAVGLPKLEDLSAVNSANQGTSWMMTDITVSTLADQTPVATGRKVSDLVRDGRRIARFVSDAPIRSNVSVHSARYAEKHRQHRGIDLAVYYHPGHAWNVDRILNALQASIDRYEAAFRPYPFSEARIIEFPGYAYFAQAFAGSMPFSETLGFVVDYSDPETIDHVAEVATHEMGHQYWGHQLVPAKMEGNEVLTETLAEYSSRMVMKTLYGEDIVRRSLRNDLRTYLQGRRGHEVPLVRVGDESYVHSYKGALVMNLLQKRLGEEAVNRALRSLLNKYKFKGAPYARSLDLIAALRAEAKTPEDQALITDLFERITLFDLRAVTPHAERRPDGKWEVTVPVDARKFYAGAKGAEKEAPLVDQIEVGLFTAEPGSGAFDRRHVILMQRQPIRSGRQVLKFVIDRRPTYAGIDPYNFYIDRNSSDNVASVRVP